jgi:hypothetical protein
MIRGCISLEARRFKRGDHALTIGGEQFIVGGRSQCLDIRRSGQAAHKLFPRQVLICRHQPVEEFDARADLLTDRLNPAEIGLPICPVIGEFVGRQKDCGECEQARRNRLYRCRHTTPLRSRSPSSRCRRSRPRSRRRSDKSRRSKLVLCLARKPPTASSHRRFGGIANISRTFRRCGARRCASAFAHEPREAAYTLAD